MSNQIRIGDLLKADTILLNLSATTKEAALDEQLYQEMQRSLDQIDELFSTDPPELHFFSQLVQETQTQVKKRLVHRLMLFWAVALLVLLIMYVAELHAPLFFICLQGVSFLSAVFILTRRWGDNNDRAA